MQTDTINSLPISRLSGAGIGNIRNPLQSIQLLPGASFANDNTLRINGMPSSSQAIRIEGQTRQTGSGGSKTNRTSRASTPCRKLQSRPATSTRVRTGRRRILQLHHEVGNNSFHGRLSTICERAFNAGTPFTDRSSIGDVVRTGQHLGTRSARMTTDSALAVPSDRTRVSSSPILNSSRKPVPHDRHHDCADTGLPERRLQRCSRTAVNDCRAAGRGSTGTAGFAKPDLQSGLDDNSSGWNHRSESILGQYCSAGRDGSLGIEDPGSASGAYEQ